MHARLDISILFLKAYALLKEHFNQLMLFGVMSALIGSVVQFIPISGDVSVILKGILSLVMALIQIWITISLILIINSKLLGEELSPKEALNDGKNFFGNYLITNIYFGFRVMVIGLPLLVLFSIDQNIFIYIIGGAFAIVGLLYVLIHYSYAPIMRILNPEVDSPFATSYSLTRNYRFEIFTVFFFVGLLTVITQLSVLTEFVFYPLNVVLEIVASAFVIPFSTIVSILLYQFLVDQHEESSAEGEAQTQTE